MHNIAQTKDGEWMTAWAGDTPWHKLGTKSEKLMTTHEALVAAHLNWKVEKLPLQYEDSGLMKVVPNTYGVFRHDGEKYIPLTKGKAVGKVWKALQNEDAFSFMDELMQNQEAKIEVCGALGDGETVWVLAKVPETITFNGIDVVEQYILISNTHDGTGSVRIMPTPIRVVCNNTLTMALQRGKTHGFIIRHTGKLHDRMEQVRQAMGMVSTTFQQWGSQADSLLSVKMTLDEMEDYFIDALDVKFELEDEVNADGDVIGQKKVLATRGANMVNTCKQLLFSPNNTVGNMAGTAWAAYNALTEAIDHKFTQLANGQQSTKRTESALFGPLARRKVQAWNKALELVQ
jgi:phage/plasmid-like protein (TIGR03299 family)